MSAAALQGMAILAAGLSLIGICTDYKDAGWFYFWCGLGALSGLILLTAPWGA